MAKAGFDAIAAHLGTPWTSTDTTVLAVQALNAVGETPADGSPFIELEFPLTNERQFDFGSPGSNLYRQEGVFRIVINEQRGVGIERALGWADELAALFRGKTFSNVQCFEVSGPVIDDRNDLGNYFQISVACRYWFYVTG